MPNVKDTYIVHCAKCKCSMGMRDSYAVLTDTHGIFLRQQPKMTVKDAKRSNLVCFGGCYSMENPITKAKAKEIKQQADEECQGKFLDNVMNFFTVSKKQEVVQYNVLDLKKGQAFVLGECNPCIIAGQEWSEGKEGVEIDEARPMTGKARLYCKYGGVIEMIETGQQEENS